MEADLPQWLSLCLTESTIWVQILDEAKDIISWLVVLFHGMCGDLGIKNKTPNQMLTRRLPHTKCINALLRIGSMHPSG